MQGGMARVRALCSCFLDFWELLSVVGRWSTVRMTRLVGCLGDWPAGGQLGRWYWCTGGVQERCARIGMDDVGRWEMGRV